MSPCPDVEMLAAFVTDTTSAEEIVALAEHLEQCADCREVLQLVRRSFDVPDED